MGMEFFLRGGMKCFGTSDDGHTTLNTPESTELPTLEE